ncbi:four helix bundle protein [Telluribacter sp. SYSU D00476]|uniref:four helix bundle protein n=1 Tax=Telluribacter sp. SYSU D00476 TaxID=2811430 RepID=UPI001FF3BB69|nr:four helix bundle protein [Telluribacter sp. SYSU D00476]
MGEEKESIIQTKSFAFAIRIVKVSKWLIENHKAYALADQLLRSGTSIGANVEEAEGGFTKKDFSARIGIAYREARETRYWLKLLFATGYLSEEQYQSLYNDCQELIKILASIQKTTKQNLNDNR